MLETYTSREQEPIAMLLAGDFNATPKEPLHKYLRGEKMMTDQDWSLICNKPDSDTERVDVNKNVRNMFVKHHDDVKCPMTLKCMSDDVKYTMYAPGLWGKPGTIVDYVYCNGSLERAGLVPMPLEEDIAMYKGVPCVAYPSDHFALVMDLKWSNETME